MIIDARTRFCNATALNTGGAGTYNIGDVIDLGEGQERDIGQGEEIYLVVQVATTATSGGSATGQFVLRSAATVDLTSSPVTHLTSVAFTVAAMTAGTYIMIAAIPREGASAYLRYLGLVQVTGTAAFTAGAITAFLTADPQGWKAYKDAVN